MGNHRSNIAEKKHVWEKPINVLQKFGGYSGKPKVLPPLPTNPPTKPETLLLKLIRSGIYPSISPIKSLWVGRLEKGT